MPRLNLKDIEERIKPLAGRDEYDREIIFELLLAYGRSKGNVTRLRNGSLNVAADPEREVAQKNVVYFCETGGDLLAELEELRVAPAVVKYSPRFVIVTDDVDVIALDTKTGENRTFPLRQIDEHFTFFLPWAGMEKAQYTAESHADVKAAEKMGKLFDELASANPGLLEDAHWGYPLFVDTELAGPPCPAEGCSHGTTTPIYRGVPPRRREPGPRYRTNDPGGRPATRSRRTTARQLGQKRTPPAHIHRRRSAVTGGDSRGNRPAAQGSR